MDTIYMPSKIGTVRWGRGCNLICDYPCHFSGLQKNLARLPFNAHWYAIISGYELSQDFAGEELCCLLFSPLLWLVNVEGTATSLPVALVVLIEVIMA